MAEHHMFAPSPLVLVTLVLLLSSLRATVSGFWQEGYSYAKDGPYEVGPMQQHSVTMNATQTDCAVGLASFCGVHVDIYSPITLESRQVSGQEIDASSAELRNDLFPIAIFSTAFMIGTDSYATYATRLASWGYIVAVWAPDVEIRGFHCTFRSRGLIAAALIDFVQSTLEPSGHAQNKILNNYKDSPVFMMGHSDGAKTAMLAAEFDRRVVGVLGLDPIDCPPPAQTEGYDYPSALKLMNTSNALVAWIGSEYGSLRQLIVFPPCAPTTCNYEKFYDASHGRLAWKVMIRGSGTMQFCDHGNPTDLVCVNGDVPRENVTRIAHTVMVAWAECTVRRVNIVDRYLAEWTDEQIAEDLIEAEWKKEEILSHISPY